MKQRVSRLPVSAAARLSLPFLTMGACIWLLNGQIDGGLFAALPTSLAALTAPSCVSAALLCALSLWAVARYDGLAHRHFQTGISEHFARKSGFAAIAVAQAVGFGIFTGAAVRWRMLPDLGLTRALKLSTFVSVTFMAALAFLTALVCLILPPAPWMTLPALALVLGLPVAVAFLSFARQTAAFRHRVRIPSLCTIKAILGWSGLDLIAACAALYLFLPPDTVSFAHFLPVFLLALGAAMISGAPGGVGPFELTLISLLPQVPTGDLVTAIVAFRVLYYALPAVLAVVVIFTTKRLRQRPQQMAFLPLGATPELGILAQNGGTYMPHSRGGIATWQTSQTTTQLFDPVQGPVPAALSALSHAAKRANRLPCVYKCSARTAAIARAQGWTVARIAQENIVDLNTYDLALPARRGLRRKLRKAEKSGVTVTRAQGLPLAEMQALDTAWQTAQGKARGGTMGQFCPEYLRGQDVYLAHRNGELIAFASFHRGATSTCLDLMRHQPHIPDGTMHLLVQTAIARAKAAGKATVSLAATPDMPHWTRRTGPFATKFTNPGLVQFKRAFDPGLSPRYAAAPSRLALAIALADITIEVHWPAPVENHAEPHNKDEDYELALNTGS